MSIARPAPTMHGSIRRPAEHPAQRVPATAPAVTGRRWPGRKSPVPARLAAVPADLPDAPGARPEDVAADHQLETR